MSVVLLSLFWKKYWLSWYDLYLHHALNKGESIYGEKFEDENFVLKVKQFVECSCKPSFSNFIAHV